MDVQSRHVAFIGDHKQLPPVITSRKAQAGGLGVSLFERLTEEKCKWVCEEGAGYSLMSDRSSAIDHARPAVPDAPVAIAVPVV